MSNSSHFDKVKEFVDQSFKYNKRQIRHFDRTVYWIKQLKSAAGEEFLIAAYAHDIERAWQSKDAKQAKSQKGFRDPEFLKNHQEGGARIMRDFLENNGADNNLIDKVSSLISHHEVGGDDDQNLLKDADSLSFVENNAQIFISRLQELGYDKVREKFDWMYERITLPQAKQIAKPFYEKMITDLDAAVE